MTASYTWSTDTHLDFLDQGGPATNSTKQFIAPFTNIPSSGIFLTGDISNASELTKHLSVFEANANKPVYFVLGNHDFYGGDFSSVRADVIDLCSKSKNLRYLSNSGVISLTKRTALVGHDGWYDAYYGDPFASPYIMSDWFKIGNFRDAGATREAQSRFLMPHVNKSIAVAVARKAAVVAATHVEKYATEATQNHDTVVILTHVPPFIESHTHDGKGGSQSGSPWYTSRLMGDALRRVASQNPRVRFEVFCGHTHEASDVQIQENLFCHVGGSEYGRPDSCGMITLP